MTPEGREGGAGRPDQARSLHPLRPHPHMLHPLYLQPLYLQTHPPRPLRVDALRLDPLLHGPRHLDPPYLHPPYLHPLQNSLHHVIDHNPLYLLHPLGAPWCAPMRSR